MPLKIMLKRKVCIEKKICSNNLKRQKINFINFVRGKKNFNKMYNYAIFRICFKIQSTKYIKNKKNYYKSTYHKFFFKF